MDVALDHVDAQLDGGSEGHQRVLRALIGVSAMTTEQNAAAPKVRRQALRVGDRHRPMLRELSRAFYIRSHAQEISHAAVTPLAALARAGRLSHDPTQDPIAAATAAGASDRDRAAVAVSDGGPPAAAQARRGASPCGP